MQQVTPCKVSSRTGSTRDLQHLAPEFRLTTSPPLPIQEGTQTCNAPTPLFQSFDFKAPTAPSPRFSSPACSGPLLPAPLAPCQHPRAERIGTSIIPGPKTSRHPPAACCTPTGLGAAPDTHTEVQSVTHTCRCLPSRENKPTSGPNCLSLKVGGALASILALLCPWCPSAVQSSGPRCRAHKSPEPLKTLVTWCVRALAYVQVMDPT